MAKDDVFQYSLGHTKRIYNLSISIYALARNCAQQFILTTVATYNCFGSTKLEFFGLLCDTQVLCHLNAEATGVAKVQVNAPLNLDLIDQLRIEDKRYTFCIRWHVTGCRKLQTFNDSCFTFFGHEKAKMKSNSP